MVVVVMFFYDTVYLKNLFDVYLGEMGSKRSYADEEPLQLRYKYLKQLVTDEKMNCIDEELTPIRSILPGLEYNKKINIYVGQNTHMESQLVDYFEVKSIHEAPTVVDKGLVDGFGFPWITDGHGDDLGWYRDFHGSLLPEYFESNFPRSAPVYVDDTLSFFLDSYPRKEVPVGANHQADLPEWSPKGDIGCSLSAPISSKVLVNDERERCMGTCVIPMPDSSLLADNSVPVGAERKDCDCVDTGSVRCVRQHVKEARAKLLKDIGEDKFRELGFVDIGEEVTHIWTKEEEQAFHEVVFSNPASLGKKFWLCLSDEFPSRSTRDLVSYYFNVFMLRKRAAQNRLHHLDIDSDDDEWHPGHGRFHDIGFVDEEVNSMVVPGELSSEEDDGSNDDDSDIHKGTNSKNADREEPSLPNMGFLHQDGNFIIGNLDDSCHSFDHPSSINDSTPTETGVPTKAINGLNSKYFSPIQTESSNGMNPGCLDYSCNIRQWDQGFSSGLDHLLPTSNMIEEIFGPGSWDNRPDHD
ncbi:unnamed protein product [Rhodiola kirilowii]